MKEPSYEVIVTDKNGKVIQRVKGPSRSYLVAYCQFLFLLMRQTGNVTIKDTGGVNRACVPNYSALRGEASAGNVYTGIRVGTGTTPVDISDYALETPIAQGTGAGQLNHLACDANSPTVTATESVFELTRIAVNGSGGTITVREIGVYATGYDSTVRYFCTVRDVLGGPVTVPDGGSITVTYSFKAVE